LRYCTLEYRNAWFPMPKKGYSSVTLPSALIHDARRMLKSTVGKKYRSLTELTSEALRDKLVALKGIPIVSTKEISRDEAQRLVFEYLEKNPGFHYPSDVAHKLGLDLELVFEITESLVRAHVVETASKIEAEA